MKKIILVGTDEGSFDYNRNLNFEHIKSKQIEIQLHAEMVFTEGGDRVLLQTRVLYLQGKDQILNYSVALLFKVKEWNAYIKDMSDVEILASDETKRMLAITVGFLRGSLSLQERSTSFKGAFLPLVAIEDFAKDIVVNRLKK